MRKPTLLSTVLAFLALQGLVAFPEKSFGRDRDAEDIFKRVIETNANRYSKISSLDYTASVIYSVLPGGQKQNSDHIIYHETEIELQSKGSLYKIASRQRLSPEADFEEKLSAYDGSYYQGFRSSERRLTLSRVRPVGEVTLGSNVLFAPFRNLLIPKTDSVYMQDFTELFTNPTNWQALLQGSLNRALSTQPNGELVVFFPISIPHSNAAFCEISFSSEKSFPCNWSLMDEKKELITVCRVDDFIEVPVDGVSKETFLFPQQITLVNYVDGKPNTSTTVTIKSIKVNQELDDSLFTIDPSTASNVHDFDSDIVISVPQ